MPAQASYWRSASAKCAQRHSALF